MDLCDFVDDLFVDGCGGGWDIGLIMLCIVYFCEMVGVL